MGTRKNRLAEAVLTCTHNLCFVQNNYTIIVVLFNQRTICSENAHLKPDLGVLSHNEMTLTLNTHTPLLTS